MPTYKLYYFNLRGRAETARMLFKLAGQDFEDIRLDKEKGWPEFKSKTPMGVLPVLEVDGTIIGESNTIGRYLAREFGYAGKDSLAMARADMVVDALNDIVSNCMPIYRAKTDEEKAEETKTFLEKSLEPGLEKIQAILEQNKGGDGFFVGDEVTVADLAFLTHADFALILTKSDLSKFPKLKALWERVEAIPKIAAWIKERPVTHM